jgi:ABC-type transporter Mla maintaining outer membrane lipid asymmetry ATPase subunit MlaF
MPATTQEAERKNLLLPDSQRWPLDESKPVIELIDVYKAFGPNKVINGLSLKVIPGKSTVIVGRSGSGKSVLLKLMMGLLRPDSGQVILFGQDVASLGAIELIEIRKRMSMMFQNYALLDSLSVQNNIGFTLLENTSMARPQVMELAHELIDILGLTGFGDALPAQLSGGMRKRVSLARALIANPEVVLFDEPTTGLDPIMIEKVDQMILLAKRTYQITSVIISHDMASAKRLSDRVAFLHTGKIVWEGNFDEFMTCELPAVKSFMEGAQTSRLAPVTGVGTMDMEDEQTQEVGEAPVVELVELNKHFGDHHVLKGVNLRIFKGNITVLIGGSGSGKSVIVKHIMGLFKPTSGEVRVFGQNIVALDGRDLDGIRGRFGMLFQHAALLDWLTVAGNVAFPLEERTNTPKKEIREQVDYILERLHIAEIRDRMPSEISEGQKKRVGLARAIIMRPEIMIYDEPTTGQDPVRTRDVDNMIQEAQADFDITSIVISHDMASTFRIADRIALLHEGQIAAYGTPEEVRASPDEYVQHFIYSGKVES